MQGLKKIGKGKSFQLKLIFKISKTIPGFTQEVARTKRNDSVLGFPYWKLNLDIQIVRREGDFTSLLTKCFHFNVFSTT